MSTFRLRMSHRCSIGFRSGDMLGQLITFTLSFFSKAVVVIMLEYHPVAQSPEGGDHALLQYVTYMLAFMVPSMNCSSPVPAALMQPQTMTLPPPCLTVGKTHLSLYSSPGCCHTCVTPRVHTATTRRSRSRTRDSGAGGGRSNKLRQRLQPLASVARAPLFEVRRVRFYTQPLLA